MSFSDDKFFQFFKISDDMARVKLAYLSKPEHLRDLYFPDPADHIIFKKNNKVLKINCGIINKAIKYLHNSMNLS